MEASSFFTRGRIVAVLALTTCLLWGSAFPGVKYGYKLFHIMPGDVPSQLLFAGYRFTLAGFLVLAFALISGRKIFDFKPDQWPCLIRLGLLMTTAQYIFFYIGIANTSGVKGSIINSTSTFFSVILAHFIYKADRLTGNTVIGCVLGFAGVISVNWGRGGFETDFKLMGEGFLIVSCFCLAAAGIYGKSVSRNINPALMTGWQLTIGGAVLVAIGLPLGGCLSGFTPASGALLGYLAFLSSTAFVLYSILLKHNPVSRVAIFNFTIPLFGALLSAIFLGDKLLDWKYLLALILVCAGIWLVTSRWRD